MIFLPNAVRDDSRLHHLLQRLFGHADGAHAVMDAARTETALRDLKTAALAEQNVFLGNANVLEQHLGMAVRRVVVAEHRQHLFDLDAGRVERHQDLRLRADGAPRSGSVLPIRIAILQRGSPTPDDHHLRPLMT